MESAVMKKVKSMLVVLGVAAALAVASVAAAQDVPPGPPQGQMDMQQPGGPGMQQPGGRGGLHGDRGGRNVAEGLRQVVQIAADETGLTPREIAAQVMQGSTLAEVITANGGDVQAVIDAAIAALTDRISQAVAAGSLTQQQADEMLANLSAVIDQALNGAYRLGEGRGISRDQVQENGARILVQAAADATGLTPQAVLAELRQGSTLTEVVTANGGSVQAVLDTALQSATDRINQAVASGRMTQAQADELIANLTQRLTSMMNGDLAAVGAGVRERIDVIRLVLDQTGLTGPELRQQLAGGATLGEVLTANGVDISAFVTDISARAAARLNVLVVDGRITQERADELLASFQANLRERLDQPGSGVPRNGEGVGV
jgi:hypothetical protein